MSYEQMIEEITTFIRYSYNLSSEKRAERVLSIIQQPANLKALIEAHPEVLKEMGYVKLGTGIATLTKDRESVCFPVSKSVRKMMV